MTRLFKWVYKLGYRQAMNKVYVELEKASEFHRNQAQIKHLQKQVPDQEWLYEGRKVSAKDHNQRALAIDDVLNHLDPKKYPNIDSYLEQLR